MTTPQAPPPPEAILFQMMFGRSISFAIAAIARLGIADHMNGRPVSAAELAASAGVNEAALFRVMRTLSSVGVFASTPEGFVLTPIGELLRTAAPGSLRNMATMIGDEWISNAYMKMDHSIRTGVDGVTAAYGKHAFEIFPQIPHQAETFHRAMTDFTTIVAAAAVEARDFSRFRRMADVGGGHGILLGTILRRHPSMRGVLFELGEVLEGAMASGHFAGCDGRIEYERGSFLERVPAGCDAYIMKHIIHDWDDATCQRILARMGDGLRTTDAANGRVFLVEMVVPDEIRPGPEMVLDLEMLVATPGGKERTRAEFAAMLAGAGMEIVNVTPTKTPMCIIEARLS